jgi:lipopolysaccharide transport system ATP-binding protein
MSDIALRTVGLGKMYRIGGEREKYQHRTLRDALVRAAKRPVERVRHPGATTHTSQVLWALRNIDLEIRHGEALGIIGRNGAGKSTLLKVLSHITEPTEGRVEIQGRVASLLEVGTGFHAELTGRENIQLNGAILGMTRADIKNKFDEIVEFSEIGRFLDTPVKRYSSGMYVRLAFAVAAHLEPEILIIDEVLAVGDAAFQKKCLGKMEDVASGGRTVLFVSHNMQAIRTLCDTAVWIDAGTVVRSGEADTIVGEYLSRMTEKEAFLTWTPGEGPGNDEARLVALEVLDSSGEVTGVVDSREPFDVRIEFELSRVDPRLGIGLSLSRSDGTRILISYHTDGPEEQWPELHVGRNSLLCTIPAGLLNDGMHFLGPRIVIHGAAPIVKDDVTISFEVHRDTGNSPYALRARPLEAIAPILPWRN